MQRGFRTVTLSLTAGALLCCTLLLGAPEAGASFDEYSDDNAPRNLVIQAQDLTLTLKGEVELELHDLQGKGGPGYDSPTDTRTIGTRSPFVEIDGFWLALRVGLDEGLQVNSLLEFWQQGARVGAVWGDWRARAPGWLEHHVELGYALPIVAIDRGTERYPLLGTVYWREPEFHVAWEGSAALGERVALELGGSLAMMRPLQYAPVQDSRSQPSTISILASGPARAYSGNGPVAGGRLRLSGWGLFVEGFGFAGRLAAQYGTQVLDELYNYKDLPGYAPSSRSNQDFHWYGGRLGARLWGATALVEAITSREGLLRRQGAYAQLGYRLSLRDPSSWFHTLAPVVRYGTYRIADGARVQSSGRALRSTAPVYAGAWDYDVLTVALACLAYRDLLRLRVEYALVTEHNGVPDLDLASEDFDNNELVIQAELRF